MKIDFPLMSNNFTREDLDLVIKYLKNKDPILTQSKNVELFEKEWSKWLGVKYSVYVNSGSSNEALWSPPFICLSNVKCLSTIFAPNATAPKEMDVPVSCPEYPITACGNSLW